MNYSLFAVGSNKIFGTNKPIIKPRAKLRNLYPFGKNLKNLGFFFLALLLSFAPTKEICLYPDKRILVSVIVNNERRYQFNLRCLIPWPLHCHGYFRNLILIETLPLHLWYQNPFRRNPCLIDLSHKHSIKTECYENEARFISYYEIMKDLKDVYCNTSG